MKSGMLDEIKQRQELLREKQWPATEKWRVIQETLAWAEQQGTVSRNNPKTRLQEQAAKLAALRSK